MAGVNCYGTCYYNTSGSAALNATLTAIAGTQYFVIGTATTTTLQCSALIANQQFFFSGVYFV
jgi:hypothetical protein